MRYSAVLLIVLMISTVCSATEDTVKLVKNIKPAVVLIQTFDANNSPLATGSGFFIDNKGSLITNHHVIEGAYSATVKTSQGKEYQITAILAKDTEADIVKLSCGRVAWPEAKRGHGLVSDPNGRGNPARSPSSDPNFPFLKLSTQIPSEGEDIVVVGNPLGLESSVSTGIVSAVRNIPAFGKIIQITAPISPGSSGSPVVNSKGEVIGIATLIMTKGQNLNFAMPTAKIVALKNSTNPASLKGYIAQASNVDVNDAQSHYEMGLKELWQENWGIALSCFKKATAKNPKDSEAWLAIGLCYDNLKCYQEAIDAYKRAIRIKPSDALAHESLGFVCFKLGHYEEAVEAYKQAILIEPNDASTHNDLGFTYSELNRYQEAIEAYKQAIRIEPDHVKAHYNLGCAYFKLGRYQDAMETYKQFNRINPDDADAHYDLGATYLKLGRYQDAVEAFNQAIRIQPDLPKEHFRLALGFTYGKLGRYQDEIAAYKQAIRINPDSAAAHFALGAAYFGVGHKGSALQEYKILKTLDAEQANKLFNVIYGNN